MKTMDDTLAWPRGRRSEALTALGLGLEASAVEEERVHITAADAHTILRNIGPALIDTDGGLLVIDESGALLDPSLNRRKISADALAARLRAPAEAPHVAAVDALLHDVNVSARRRGAARDVLLAQRTARTRIATATMLRAAPGATLIDQVRELKMPRRIALHVAAFAAVLLLDVVAWVFIGRGALEGRVDVGFLVAWGLTLLSAVPLHALGTWCAGLVALDAGALLKRRLLAGALSLDPEEVKHVGAGGHLARAIEAEEVESLGFNGASNAAAGVLELAVASALLIGAVGVGVGVTAVAVHALVVVMLVVAAFRARSVWTQLRLTMTHALVENLIGHRTRLAQQAVEQRHVAEDASLDAWLRASRTLDRREVALQIVAGRGVLIAVMLALAPTFVVATQPLAIIAGVAAALLAQRAWRKLSLAAVAGSSALLAWRQARVLWDAAARTQRSSVALPNSSPDAAVLEARAVSFAHAQSQRRVLRDVDLRIAKGDRVLLEGASGSGKSTLASILTGLREPTSGLALLGGIDHKTIGTAAWRARVASAPQFHENHILTGTLAFNVLLGRAWPPTESDLREAERMLRALGLSTLLERMPSGMMQVVGETGWQLSHGERSRVFLARALLQRADLVVLDETFGALDPSTMRQALETTFAEASSLVVVAHP